MKLLRETLFIFVVALIFAGLTAGVNSALRNKIELNDETRYSRYLLEALKIDIPPGAPAETIQKLQRENVVKDRIKDRVVYAEIDETGTPEKYAFPIAGKGFWGNIYGILALNDEMSQIKGIVFTNHNETPGLGARIEEEWFREQFRGLEMEDAPGPEKYLIISKADPEKRNHIDAITGATMTSSLLQILLNDEIDEILALKDEIRSHQWPSPQRN